MTEEWRMELIGPGTQEAKESWHAVTPATLADYTGSKPCTVRPHFLSRPKKNMYFLLCSLSQYEDWYTIPTKQKKGSFPWLCHPVCAPPVIYFKSILYPFSSPELCAKKDLAFKNKQKKGEWGKSTSAQNDGCKESKSHVRVLWKNNLHRTKDDCQ